jgi:signal transduction histidine kinase
MKGEIEKLEAQLASAADARQRIDVMNVLAWELRFSDLPRAIALSQQARELAGQDDLARDPYREGLAQSVHNLGRFSLQLGHHESALSLLFKSLSLFEDLGDLQGRAGTLDVIGVTFGNLGDYPNALEYFLRALEIYVEAGVREKEAAELNNVGYVHLSLGDYDRALTYLGESLQISQEVGAKEAQADALDNSCSAYYHLGDYESALTFGSQSVELYQGIGSRRGEAEALDSVGDVYLIQGDYAQALACFDKALRISEEIGLRYEMVRALQRIGGVYRRQEQLEAALLYLHRAQAVAQEINAKQSLYECHQALAEIYKQSGDLEQALEHYERFQTVKEEVFNEQADQRLKNLDVVYQVETAKRETEIYHLRNVALQQEIRERRKAQEALQSANAQLQQEIVAREQLIADLDAFAHTVAHDLRSPLSAIVGYSELLEITLLGLEVEDTELLQLTEPINRMAIKMSHIIDGMLLLASASKQKEVVLQSLDMAAIVREVEERLVRMIDESQAEIVKPSAWPEAWGYGPWVEEVWTNYISNAVRYGGDPLRVELGATPRADGMVRFWVRDNGAGLSPKAQSQLFTPFTRLDEASGDGYGLGLSIVKRIVERLGGEVGVESEGVPGRGSTFSFTLPSVVQSGKDA